MSSWTMWHVYGTGIDIAKVNAETYRNFILNHRDSLEKIEWKPYNISLDEFLYYFEEGCLESDEIPAPDLDDVRDKIDSGRLADPVAAIMQQETGICFAYPGVTDDGEDYVLFTAANPWEYNEKEKGLTFNSLKEIMVPYAEELGLSFEDDVDLIYAG